ncbi:TonB-dependent receptor [Luteimonas sp. SX5]|uniref:TonB-dependent receptor n=1 Tax=Luteimonas galliterrae TaxID=2940486 RepID=A0ABT0MG24_9GAMM|nr:TonB-dependent receptor [Luteimonas galliterrae]MCL1633811.1 TonB-dependent receptor [Luteimonas galliterrae]
MKQLQAKKTHLNRRILSCALASCLAMVAGGALAQSTGATLRGQVTADSAPASGASVTATNTRTGLTRTVQTLGGGNYSLAGLPPGSYKVDVTADGKTTSKTVTLQVGQTATLNMSVGGLPETATTGEATTLDTVTVIAAPLVETKTSEVSTYISTKQIESLPQGTRNFLAFADTVPGVQFVVSGNGSATVRSGAQTANGVNVFIDGVGQKNYVLPGGVSGQDDTRGNPFPQSAIGEYKVITSNYKAEFDQLSSAAITAVTRSGTNEFEGDVFWDRTSSDWRKPTPAEEKAGIKARSKEEQYGITFSGPIIKDQMHFFLAYEAKTYATPFTVTQGEGAAPSDIPEQFRGLLGPTVAPFQEDLFFGKIDWSIGQSHLLELTAKYRDETEITGIGGVNALPFATAKDNDDLRVDLRWQYSADRWINDMHVTFEDSNYEPGPVETGNGYILTRDDNDENGGRRVLAAGPGENGQQKGQKGYSLQDDLTFLDLEWHGFHTVKAGFKYKVIDVNAVEQFFRNPQYFYDIDESTTQPYLVRYASALPGIGNGSVESRNKQFGIYIQDDWEVNDKLTLNLGIRWDWEESPIYLNYRTPADVLAAFNGPDPRASDPNQTYAQTLALGGIDINKFISNGSNRKNFKDGFQPRLGFSYDLKGDERHVIFGGAGRSYDRNIFNNLQLEATKGTFPVYSLKFNTPDHPCTVGVDNCFDFDPSFFNRATLDAIAAASPNAGREVFMLSNDLKTPYSDQFSIGMRNAVAWGGTDFNTTVTLSRIESHDGFAFLLGNRRPDGSFFEPGAIRESPFGFGLPGFQSVLLGVNGIETKANALALQIDKPYTQQSPWSFTAAYTYTDAKENRQFNETFSLDYPTLEGYGWFQAAGIPEHRLVLSGIYDGPWGLTFSGKYTISTSTPYYYVDDTNSPPGRSTQSVVAQFEPDSNFQQLDLAVQKNFIIQDDVRFRIRADLLNVFDERNYNSYDLFTGRLSEPSGLNEKFGIETDGIILPTRTFKLSAGFSW